MRILRGAVVLSVFRKAQEQGVRAGIALGTQSLALAVIRRVSGAKPVLVDCAQHAIAAEAGVRTLLERAGAGRLRTCAVLDSDEYQLVQVEAPDVLPSELRAAIRWRLRDAISFNIDEAAVDVFDIPDPARKAGQKMLFAVAARDTAIQRVAGSLKDAARGLDSIDIPELCLRNLSALLPQDQKGVAMLALNENFVQLVITRQGVLYLTRRVDIRRSLSLNNAGAETDIDASALALELQRSLDYYESHYDQTPIGDLVIAPADERATRLADSLRAETSLRIAVLDAREHFVVNRPGEVIPDWASLMAVGAALRDEGASS
jgi:MSHA biogenesis protein MshI